MIKNVSDAVHRHYALEAEKGLFNDAWDKIIKYCLPNSSSVYDTYSTQGEIRNAQEVFDSTANQSALRTASVINSMLTNQSSEWFKVETDNDELNETQEMKKWLQDTTETIRESIDNSNFYTQIHEFYIDLVTVGTATLYISESRKPDTDIYFSVRHIKEIYIDEDDEGEIDTVFRKFQLTPRQMVQRWGKENLNEAIISKAENNDEDKIDILHAVFPRAERDLQKKDARNMPIASMWIDLSSNELIQESGYQTFPYVIARWSKSSGEKYGRSPGWSALPDIQTLNEMEKVMLKTGHKIADPPMFIPDEEIDVDLTPGALNYYNPNFGGGRPEPLQIGANMPLTDAMSEQKRQSIRDIFYVNQLQLIDKTMMTASEVQQRTDENMRVLAPTFGRLQTEYLGKLMERIINILDVNQKLPQLPEDYQEIDIKLRYISPLAKAQRFNEVQTITYTIETAVGMAQASPEVLDNIDFDVALRKLSDINGTPVGILRSMKEINNIRQQRAEQQQQQQQIQMAAIQAELQEKQSQTQKNMTQAQKNQAAANK